MVFLIINIYEILLCILSIVIIFKKTKRRILITKKFILSYPYPENDKITSIRKKYFLKCCNSIFLQYVLFGRKEVKIFFKPIYSDNLFKRIVDWIIFCFRYIKYYLLKNKKNKIKPATPFHSQSFYSVDEAILEKIVTCGGFKILNEKIETTTSLYIICEENYSQKKSEQ